MKYYHIFFSFAIFFVKINSLEIIKGVITVNIYNFGQHLKSLREGKNLTLTELSNTSGVSQPHLSHIENGKRGTPRPGTLKKIAVGLGVDYNELMVMAGYINKVEDLQTEVTKINTEVKKLIEEKDENELRLKLFETLKTQEKLIDVIKQMTDLQSLLNSNSKLYYKNKLLSTEDKQKILTIISTILDS